MIQWCVLACVCEMDVFIHFFDQSDTTVIMGWRGLARFYFRSDPSSIRFISQSCVAFVCYQENDIPPRGLGLRPGDQLITTAPVVKGRSRLIRAMECWAQPNYKARQQWY